jgi:outer membrane protein assembly factor BamD (BamD/ComL family)
MDESRYTAAFEATVRWLLANRDSPNRDQGLMLAAEALHESGDHVKAFYYCDELLDTYPNSRLWFAALEMQFRIGDQFLSGWRRRVLGVPLEDWTDEGVEVMFRVQQRAPGSPLAERALLRTAEFYFDDQQYDLAADAYSAYVKRYPRSPEALKARLREAYANYAQFTGPRFDPTPAINARQALSDLIAQYPAAAEQQGLPALVESIDVAMARKLLYTANFYSRTRRPQSASYLLTLLVERYPDSAEAAVARERLASLPAPQITPPATTGPVR